MVDDDQAVPSHLCGWVVLRRADQKVLLARRSGVTYGVGLWGLPGGHAQIDESWAVGGRPGDDGRNRRVGCARQAGTARCSGVTSTMGFTASMPSSWRPSGRATRRRSRSVRKSHGLTPPTSQPIVAVAAECAQPPLANW